MSALHCAAIAAKLTRVGSGPGAYPVASVLYISVLYVQATRTSLRTGLRVLCIPQTARAEGSLPPGPNTL